MDVEAIARKWIGRRLNLATLTPAVVSTTLHQAANTVREILEAAGVPEMEAQCAALRRAIDELRHDFHQCVDAVVARAERAEKRLEAAERVCKAAIAWVDDGADYGLDSWQELIDAVKAYRRLASGRR